MSANFVTRLFKLMCVKIELYRAPWNRKTKAPNQERNYGFFATLPELMPDTSYIYHEEWVDEYHKVSEQLRVEREGKTNGR